MASKTPSLSLGAVYPNPGKRININCCGDIDCGNYGKKVDEGLKSYRGPGAKLRLQTALSNNPELACGIGKYKLASSGQVEDQRLSTELEYENDPHVWMDAKSIVCRATHGNSECGIRTSILSNEHLEDEIAHLSTYSGVLDGPRCGACGKRYLDAPDEFIFNGAHGKKKVRGSGKMKPTGVRLIHEPCKGQKGARFTVSLDHQKQQKSHENIQFLRELVNDTSINGLGRTLANPRTGTHCGVARVYNRIFWLEKTLLAFEQAQLAKWRGRVEKSTKPSHIKIGRDDIVLSANWESSIDRRITALNCAISADIDSGYVFRIDVDFDPTVEPIKFFEENYLDPSGKLTNVAQEYEQKGIGKFSVPKLHFQRPSGRFDEAAFFASCENEWRLFEERLVNANLANFNAVPAAQQTLNKARQRINLINRLRNGYFSLPENERDFRGSFTGIMTRDTYTKAAHLWCLKEMLPQGRITLVSEQEAVLVRVVPHVFQDRVLKDNFQWLVIHFKKTAKKPERQAKAHQFSKAFEAFRYQKQHPDVDPQTPIYTALRRFIEVNQTAAFKSDRSGGSRPYPIENFRSKQFPKLWVKSPVQLAGEIDKVVGFPIVREKYRHMLKRQLFTQLPQDSELQAAIPRRVLTATIQPAASFMESVRERIRLARRAGGTSAKNEPGFINGAAYNPRVLMAVLNIFRIYYNFFEPRQYVTPLNKHQETEKVSGKRRSIKVPGTNEKIEVEARRRLTPVKTTPAMRLGLQKSQKMPDPHRVLYKPWLYHGTPLWEKFEGR